MTATEANILLYVYIDDLLNEFRPNICSSAASESVMVVTKN